MKTSSICEGLNVVEMGSGSIAAAIAGMVLADAGARVLKIEPPEGDLLRVQNPSGFLVHNRGKESRVIDLRHPNGQGDLRELAAAADVTIESFAPGVAHDWGIDGKRLRSVNPKLVCCDITAFGGDGPYAHLKAYDPIVAAKMGLWSRGVFAFRDGPLMFPVPWASFGAAMQAVAGIMGALIQRERAGFGQSVHVTLASGLEPIDYMVMTAVQLGAKRGAPTDDRSAMPITRHGVLAATRDGHLIQTATVQPHQARALCDAAGLDKLLTDPRFAAQPTFETVEIAEAWEETLQKAFLQRDLAHWLPKLAADPDIAFEIAVTSEEGTHHPQIIHNGDIIVVDDPQLGAVREVGPLGHFRRTPMVPTRSAPALGENRGPLASLGSAGASGSAPAPHPFAGIKIIEFGYFYAMPYATAMLASLGAQVTKIEDLRGDPHRSAFGPEVGSNKTTAGKQSLSIDLRSPEGQVIARRLVETADVFVTGFRSGVAERLGLGYEDLRVINPSLLYVNAAGYGVDGPYANRALYAQAAQAVGGSFGRQVGHWSNAKQVAGASLDELQALVFPRVRQVIDGDSNAALCVLALLSLGLFEQRRSGLGQRLDTSMIAANAWAYGDDFCTYVNKPPAVTCDSEAFGVSALERLYPAADGTWLCLAVRTAEERRALATALGDPHLQNEKSEDALVATLTALFAMRSALDWEEALSAVKVGAAAVSLQGQAAFSSFDPGLRAAGLTVAVEHPLFGEMVRWAPHIAFSESNGRVAPPCVRGEHNHAVLRELGYGSAAISALEAKGVVFPPTDPNQVARI